MAEPRIHPPPPVSTPRLSPWEHVEELVKRLDRLIALLEAQAPPGELPGWGPILEKLDRIIALIGWEAKEAEEIFSLSIRTVGVFFSDSMVRWTRGKRLLLKVESSLDQNVQIQIIGNVSDRLDAAVDINGPFVCVAGGNITIGLAWDDWHPYVGARITTAIAPTVGLLRIWAVIQE